MIYFLRVKNVGTSDDKPSHREAGKTKKKSYIHFLHLKLCRSIPPLWPIQLGWPNFAQMGIFQKEGERKWQKVSPKSDFLLFFSPDNLKVDSYAIFWRNFFFVKLQHCFIIVCSLHCSFWNLVFANGFECSVSCHDMEGSVEARSSRWRPRQFRPVQLSFSKNSLRIHSKK